VVDHLGSCVAKGAIDTVLRPHAAIFRSRHEDLVGAARLKAAHRGLSEEAAAASGHDTTA